MSDSRSTGPFYDPLMTDDFRWLDATAQADLVRSGAASARELVDAAIARIERDNTAVNAVVTPLFDKARRAATAVDDAAAEGPARAAPFAGVPFLLKDAVCHSAGDPFHQGMQVLKDAGYVAPDDTWLAARFRAAGLVTVGKSNTPEYATSATTEPLAYGATHNPWNLAHSPGGSSGGSGAAVAAGFVPVAHANDMGGSIRIPAAFCGLVGLKPSRGRTTLGPHWGQFWGTLTHEHVVSRSVRDTAAMLDAVSGPGIGDPYTAPPPLRPFLDEVGAPVAPLRVGLRLTRPTSGVASHPEVVAAAERTAQLLESLGHTVVPDPLPELDGPEAGAGLSTILAAWLAHDIDLWSARIGRPIEPGDLEPMNGMMLERGRALGAKDLVAAWHAMERYGRRAAAWNERFDLLLTPTSPVPPPPLGVISPIPDTAHPEYDPGAPAAFTVPFDVTGEPAISLPLGRSSSGLPLGSQLVAPYGREDLLLRVAAQLETAAPWAHLHPVF